MSFFPSPLRAAQISAGNSMLATIVSLQPRTTEGSGVTAAEKVRALSIHV